MCRTDLGECVVEGCARRISCQDTGGYCNEHDPFNCWVECMCEGKCTCPPQVNEAKRLRYDIARYESGAQQDEARLSMIRARTIDRDQRLAAMRVRLQDIEAAAAKPSKPTATDGR